MNPEDPRQIKRTCPRGNSDIYTLLVVIAALALFIGIGFVWYHSAALFGKSNPFEAVPGSTMLWLARL